MPSERERAEACPLDLEALESLLAEAVASALTPASGWRDIATAPKDGTPLKIRTYIVVRWRDYNPHAARQMGRPGRWQAHDGYGWNNCADPTDAWQFADPRDEPLPAPPVGEG